MYADQNGYHPRFIAVEGLEGAGKTSAIDYITRLFDYYLPCEELITTREPGGSPSAETIRNLLLEHPANDPLSSETELLLMYASRLQHIHQLIKPALAQGKWTISDRFNLSSMAYQGGGRQLGLETVQKLDKLFVYQNQPGLILYLDVPAETGLARISKQRDHDRIESEKLAFFERSRNTFIALCHQKTNCVGIDASQDQSSVFLAIEKQIMAYWRFLGLL